MKTKMSEIYTVVLHSPEGYHEDSTVSFDDWDDAVAYVKSEILTEDPDKDDIDECVEELREDGCCSYGNWEYTIYNANLCHSSKKNKKPKKTESLRSYKKKVNEYLSTCREMVNFMHEHLMDLADEQQKEYEELCEAEGEAASKL